MAVSAAVNTGDRLKALEALRDELAAAIDSCDSPRDLASLAARLMDALAQVDELKAATPAQEGTPLDALRQRREARKSGAAGRTGAEPGVDAG